VSNLFSSIFCQVNKLFRWDFRAGRDKLKSKSNRSFGACQLNTPPCDTTQNAPRSFGHPPPTSVTANPFLWVANVHMALPNIFCFQTKQQSADTMVFSLAG
jgi:hypothetical protein